MKLLLVAVCLSMFVASQAQMDDMLQFMMLRGLTQPQRPAMPSPQQMARMTPQQQQAAQYQAAMMSRQRSPFSQLMGLSLMTGGDLGFF